MVTMQLIVYSLIGVGILAAIAILGSNADWIRSVLSGQWDIAIERGRAHKARRERIYGYDMSSPAPVREQFGPGSEGGSEGRTDLVRAQQNQLEPVEPAKNEPATEQSFRQLGKEDLIVMLAIQTNDDGSYRFSANQITAFVGGTAAPIKETIAAVRGKKEAPKPTTSLRRPVNGW